MKLYYFLFLLFCLSCQPSYQLESWFYYIQDQTFTQLASKSSAGVLSEQDKNQLFVLFVDMEATQNCEELIRLVEENAFLQEYGQQHNFKKGYLFDIFYDHLTYESIALDQKLNITNRGDQELVIFSRIWKTQFSIERINSVLRDLNYCYPYAYN